MSQPTSVNLSLSFNSVKDLADFLMTIGGATEKAAAVNVEVAPVEEKPKKAKKEKAEKPELHPNPPVEAPAQPEVPASPFPAQQPAAVVSTPVAPAPTPAADKDAMITEVRAIVADQKAKGKSDEQIKGLFAEIYNKLGLTPGVPVSQLNTDQVTRFLAELRDRSVVAAPSFI